MPPKPAQATSRQRTPYTRSQPLPVKPSAPRAPVTSTQIRRQLKSLPPWHPCEKGERLIFSITLLGTLRKQCDEGRSHTSSSSPEAAETGITDNTVTSPLAGREGRTKLQLLPADTDSGAARPHLLGASGGGRVMGNRGAEGRRGALACPLSKPSTVPTSSSLPRQPEATGPGTPYSPPTMGTFEYS